MYLFEYKNEVNISYKCKFCMKEVSLTISRKEYEKIEEFPFGKEFVHEDPPHRLILYINKDLEVERFEIEDIIEKKSVLYSQELIKQVLNDIGLDDEEIRLYFLTTGKGAISLTEIALLINKPKEECQKIAEKFIGKGLYKEIAGATPHYFTLPPYAALIFQLKEFQKYANEVKESTFRQLTESFDQLESEAEGLKKLQEFSDFVIGLKQNLLSQMSTQKANVDNAIADVDNIKNIKGIIAALKEDVRKAIDNQLLLIKKKKFKEELERFFRRFSLNFKESLERTINSINEIVNTAETAKENVRKSFAEASKNFIKVLMDGEEKLGDITDGVFKTLTNLKTTFSTKVLNTFNEMLEKILKRLEISEITTKEFWEQSKQITFFTMKDVWFIKSIEGIKSQIKDEVPKSKMRLLIVAPDLTDIDLETLKTCSTRVNIRIATWVDISRKEHADILKRMSDIPNIDLRLSEVKDVWGINRDSEVIIICALGYNSEGKIAEIAGIGTSTQEHIRIFVPVIEDIWRSAKKQKVILYKKVLSLE
ncbi:MAG: hypothetical protein ACTSPD_13625 [Promethearchaeota archaeon]